MWTFESNNHQDISLHDNIFNEIIVNNDNILLVFNDGFDVAKSHPLNDTQKSKHTTKSRIDLEDAQFVKGNVFNNKNQSYEIDFRALVNGFDHFEVLQFKVENDALYFFGNLDVDGIDHQCAEIWFSCSNVIFCWNDYSSDAWFEGWPKHT